MTKSIYWYDLETTGIDPIRDRVLQFSGVRTDYDLNPLDEPQNFFCCPGNDVLPDPEAMLVTGMLIRDILARGDMEQEFTRKIAAVLSTPATCVAGYNNLRFDDEFIRHMLYRNFHDPYAREWRNDNSRWDVIDLFRTAYALRPEGLAWPRKKPEPEKTGTADIRLAEKTGTADIRLESAIGTAEVRPEGEIGTPDETRTPDIRPESEIGTADKTRTADIRPESKIRTADVQLESGIGTPSFRLEDLARENNVEHDAHNALSDVQATIAMARLLKTRQPRLYDYLFKLRDKRAVLQQLLPLGKSAVVHISTMYPASRGRAAIVLPLCKHPTNSNGIICFDLATSPESLLSATVDDLARLIFTRREQLPDGQERVALKTIHINKCPSVAPLSTLGDSEAARLGLDKALCQERLRELQRASGLAEKIQNAFSTGKAKDSADPDFMLYSGGFFSDKDRQVMTELLQASPEALPGFKGRFQDDRLDKMLFRYRARNFIATLDAGEVKQWNSYRWSNWDQGRRITQALDEIECRKQESDTPNKKAVLDDLENYIKQLAADLPAA